MTLLIYSDIELLYKNTVDEIFTELAALSILTRMPCCGYYYIILYCSIHMTILHTRPL